MDPPNHPAAILDIEPEPEISLSKSRTAAIISCVTCITGISNLLAGLLTVCIPTISADLAIRPRAAALARTTLCCFAVTSAICFLGAFPNSP